MEINCYEHFNVLGLAKVPFSVSNKWFSGSCEITTYHLDELIGTKIRALYQRKKGRDLYDLQIALQQKDINVDNVLKCYNAYMEFVVEKAPTYKQFVANMEAKLADPEFIGDTEILLRSDADNFDATLAYDLVKNTFIDRMPGKRE